MSNSKVLLGYTTGCQNPVVFLIFRNYRLKGSTPSDQAIYITQTIPNRRTAAIARFSIIVEISSSAFMNLIMFG